MQDLTARGKGIPRYDTFTKAVLTPLSSSGSYIMVWYVLAFIFTDKQLTDMRSI